MHSLTARRRWDRTASEAQATCRAKLLEHAIPIMIANREAHHHLPIGIYLPRILNRLDASPFRKAAPIDKRHASRAAFLGPFDNPSGPDRHKPRQSSRVRLVSLLRQTDRLMAHDGRNIGRRFENLPISHREWPGSRR